MAFADTGPRFVVHGFGGVEVYFAGAVNGGDLVQYNGSTGFVQADANNSLPARFIAANDFEAGEYGVIFASAVVSGFKGGTPGGLLYNSDTAGGYASSAGSSSQVVGTLYSDTVAFVQPQVPTS